MPERFGRIKFSRASKYVIKASHCCGFGQAVDDNLPHFVEIRGNRGNKIRGIGGKWENAKTKS
jgi:hypothetical protein